MKRLYNLLTTNGTLATRMRTREQGRTPESRARREFASKRVSYERNSILSASSFQNTPRRFDVYAHGAHGIGPSLSIRSVEQRRPLQDGRRNGVIIVNDRTPSVRSGDKFASDRLSISSPIGRPQKILELFGKNTTGSIRISPSTQQKEIYTTQAREHSQPMRAQEDIFNESVYTGESSEYDFDDISLQYMDTQQENMRRISDSDMSYASFNLHNVLGQRDRTPSTKEQHRVGSSEHTTPPKVRFPVAFSFCSNTDVYGEEEYGDYSGFSYISSYPLREDIISSFPLYNEETHHLYGTYMPKDNAPERKISNTSLASSLSSWTISPSPSTREVRILNEIDKLPHAGKKALLQKIFKNEFSAQGLGRHRNISFTSYNGDDYSIYGPTWSAYDHYSIDSDTSSFADEDMYRIDLKTLRNQPVVSPKRGMVPWIVEHPSHNSREHTLDNRYRPHISSQSQSSRDSIAPYDAKSSHLSNTSSNTTMYTAHSEAPSIRPDSTSQRGMVPWIVEHPTQLPNKRNPKDKLPPIVPPKPHIPRPLPSQEIIQPEYTLSTRLNDQLVSGKDMQMRVKQYNAVHAMYTTIRNYRDILVDNMKESMNTLSHFMFTLLPVMREYNLPFHQKNIMFDSYSKKAMELSSLTSLLSHVESLKSDIEDIKGKLNVRKSLKHETIDAWLAPFGPNGEKSLSAIGQKIHECIDKLEHSNTISHIEGSVPTRKKKSHIPDIRLEQLATMIQYQIESAQKSIASLKEDT